LGRIGRGGSDHVSVEAGLFGGLFDAFPHGGKPRNAGDLHDNGHLVVGRMAGNGCKVRQGQQGDDGKMSIKERLYHKIQSR
jgi:hypothetical protein